jgi:hypothetical protein
MSAMVKDAYAGLKALVKKRLGGGPGADLVLAKHEQAPETWQAPLMAELARTGADGDRDLIAAAQALLDLIGEAGGRTGKYTIDVRGGQGVQIGDHNRQDNVFSSRQRDRALQMTGTAQPGICRTKVRTVPSSSRSGTAALSAPNPSRRICDC